MKISIPRPNTRLLVRRALMPVCVALLRDLLDRSQGTDRQA